MSGYNHSWRHTLRLFSVKIQFFKTLLPVPQEDKLPILRRFFLGLFEENIWNSVTENFLSNWFNTTSGTAKTTISKSNYLHQFPVPVWLNIRFLFASISGSDMSPFPVCLNFRFASRCFPWFLNPVPKSHLH